MATKNSLSSQWTPLPHGSVVAEVKEFDVTANEHQVIAAGGPGLIEQIAFTLPTILCATEPHWDRQSQAAYPLEWPMKS